MKRIGLVTATLGLAGCLSSPGAFTRTFNFDFNAVGRDYTAGAAELPADRLADVGLIGELRALPTPLTTTNQALYLAGTNVTGHLFMFLEKRIIGLEPNATFDAEVGLQFASKIPQGCTTGVGPTTFIKAGVALMEPTAEADQQGVLRMNIDKGTDASPGDYTQLGDIRNGSAGCDAGAVYALKSTSAHSQRLTLVTDDQGGFWLWMGLESTAPGRAEVYITGLTLLLH